MKLKKITSLFLVIGVCCGYSFSCPAASRPQDERGPMIKSIVLNDATMQEVARLLSNSTSLPIIVSRKASDIKVDIYLRKSYCLDILKAICRAYGMWCRKDKHNGIIYIQTVDELRDNVQLYNDESVEVVTILYPAAVDVGDTLQQLFIDRVIWVKPNDDSGDSYDNIKNALKRMELIAKKGTFDFSASSGESAESSDDDDDDDDDDDNDKKNVAGKSLNTNRNKQKKTHRQKSKDILSQSSEQKVVAAMRNSLTERKMATAMELTGEPGMVYISALPESNTLLLRSSDMEALRQMKQLIVKLDKPSPQVLLEVKILSVDVTDTNSRAIDFLFGSGSVSGGFADGLPTVSGGGQTIESPNSLLIPQGSGIDKQAAIFNAVTENFRARIQMLEKEGRITRLATPNLLVSDNEASKLFVGKEVTVMQKAERTLTYTNSSSGAQNPNLSWNIDAPRRKIGISLVITPKIHADRTVTIRLLQERSALGDMRENVYSGGESQQEAEGDLLETDSSQGSSSESRYFLSQDIDMQSVATTVVGKDNEILVIGGFIEETAEKDVQKLPWLSEIPILGNLLFTRFEEIRKRNEILIVIRPFVLLAPGEGQQISETFMKRISLHPSARGDIPSLDLMTKKDIAKGSRINPDDPWYKRLLQRLDVWKIDMDTAPELENELRDYHLRKNDEEAQEAIKKLKQYEENSSEKKQKQDIE